MSSTLNAPSNVMTSNVLGAPLNIIQTAFAKLPDPANRAGQIWQVTDASPPYSLYMSDGAAWNPLSNATGRTTFATLPVPSAAVGQIWQVSDTTPPDSLWVSDGTSWIPINTIQTTFASLPTASISTGQIWQVTDRGVNGSLWVSDGTTWKPVTTPVTVFASLPAASASTGQVWEVTDVGRHGGLWLSDGVSWTPVNGSLTYFSDAYPFIVPSSGSVTITTGALLLTTALDITYPHCYMYFPAGTWTASVAGFYYVVMSSTTAGLVYSNTYVSGVPTTPVTPALVTTGAGAYTQDTGANITGQTLAITANVMGLNGKLNIELICATNNSADSKITTLTFAATDYPASTSNTLTSASIQAEVRNINSAAAQAVFVRDVNGVGANAVSTINTATANNLIFKYQLATVDTDWIVSKWLNIQVTQ